MPFVISLFGRADLSGSIVLGDLLLAGDETDGDDVLLLAGDMTDGDDRLNIQETI